VCRGIVKIIADRNKPYRYIKNDTDQRERKENHGCKYGKDSVAYSYFSFGCPHMFTLASFFAVLKDDAKISCAYITSLAQKNFR